MKHDIEAINSDNKIHHCTVCDEECEDGQDCCSDDFPELGDIREWS